MKNEETDYMVDEIEIEATEIRVDSQPIELYKILKIANVLSGGGEAKYAISEGYVVVNGDVELRKRCKIYNGDLIEFNQEFYIVSCEQPVTIQKKTQLQNKKNVSSSHSVKNTHSEKETIQPKLGRTKIQFF